MILSTEIELNEPNCEKHTFTLSVSMEQGIYIYRAVENCEYGRNFYYQITEDFETIKNNSISRYDILSYCLGNFTKDNEVTLKDIFLQGQYIAKLRDIGELF